MKSTDKLLTTNAKDTDLDANSIGGIEQQQEKQSVYKDLLRGEVTEQVRELRHEMYYSERKSKEYKYGGGGMAKKNTMFGYRGNIDRSDGYEVKIVQENKLITESMSDIGVVVYGDNADISADIETKIRNKPRSEKEYRIKIAREGFIPKFKIENYIKKVVIKEVNNSNLVLVDLYISKYFDKFETTSKLFHNEMEKIYQGIDVEKNILQGGILNFKELYFTTKDAYGIPDSFDLSYSEFDFNCILEFDGNYILRFYAKENKRDDLIEQYYHAPTAEKCEKHEMREGSTLDLGDAFSENEKKEKTFNVEAASALIDGLYKQ